ncbi:MbtH family NRPS accessory protein [Corallococcus interemptor]|uniref:MbtH family protein n=1 Tax=Corallococcus TaxID=83461 RepID=UPI001CBD851E|nr:MULTISPECIES: MbtH family NRPS accessory protein [unclassified Corallococcus]MBZ4336309.1 MbtH family NRPS accessory protein [Corallococcus sp. AS-1-12]MBZ4377264.1 MbtH family NRPS accessory protein [Corallococcus sp. AS-1-6]
MSIHGDEADYVVLINGEEQYSLWSAHRDIPGGWKQVGPRGSKEACQAYLKEVWTDMRPKSLRDALARNDR